MKTISGKAIFLAVVLLVLIAFRLPAAAAAAGLWPTLQEIKCTAWIVIDRKTGKTLLEKEADKKIYPASVTKIMTAILALESGKLDQTVQVSETAVNLPSGASEIGFLAGEQVVLKDVLYGMMLLSGNDAAIVIAEALAGSVPAFAEKMNAKAAAIGMKGSHFVNPNGLHDPEHYVTARDLACLAAYAMKNAKFRELVSTRSYSMPPTNLHPYYGWAIITNTNRLLQYGDSYLKSDYLACIEGIKTGTTTPAGINLAAAATSVSGQEMISILMGVPPNTKNGSVYTYSRTLLEEAAKLGGANPSPTGSPTQGTTTVTTTATSATTNATTSAATTAAPSSTPGISPALSPRPASPTPAAGSESLKAQADGWRLGFLVLSGLWLVTILLSWSMISRLLQERARLRSKKIKPGRPDA